MARGFFESWRNYVKMGLGGLVLSTIGYYLVYLGEHGKTEPYISHEYVLNAAIVLSCVGAFFLIGSVGLLLLVALGKWGGSGSSTDFEQDELKEYIQGEIQKGIEGKTGGYQRSEKIYEYDPGGRCIGYSIQIGDKIYNYDKNEKEISYRYWK